MRKLPIELKGYVGNKSMQGMTEKIINLIPPHSLYIEPFVGSGSIFRAIKPANRSIINDLDPTVVNAWKDQHEAGTTDVFNLTAIQLVQLIASIAPGHTDVFIYMDPPYPKEFRLSKKKLYKFDMTLEDHDKLLYTAANIKYNCMISTNENPIYEEKLKNWNKKIIEVSYQGKSAKEIIYFNYQPPIMLHDYRYLGNDAWDRQRIKRKISKLISKLNNLPILEKNAIIESITNRGPYS